MRLPRQTLFIAALIGLLANAAGFAQSTTAEHIELLQKQLDELKNQVGTSRTPRPVWYQAPPEDPLAGVPTVPPSALPAMTFSSPVATTAAAKPVQKSFPDFKMTGFFHLDAARFAQSDESRATVGDVQDGAGFRRARLAATGNISERGSYMMEFDMAQAQARFVDVWGQVKDTPLGTMRIGRFRQPFGMSELTSIRELGTLERPTAFALSPFRQTGIMFSDVVLEEQATWAVSGFRTLSDNFGNVYGDHGGIGTAERLTWLMLDCGDSRLVHFGLDHSYIDPARDQVQIASQDEVFVGQQPNLGPTGLSVSPIVFVPPFVNTGVFNVDHANLFNIEGAASWGRGLVQAEQRWSRLALPTGERATVNAGYITLRFMLTGETIPYNRAGGVFTRIKPDNPLDLSNGSMGAWEVVGQMSTINLNPLFGLPSVTGPTRRLDSYSLALNWYWWTNAKAQFEWINGSLNDPTLGGSVSNTLASRLQFDF